MLMLCFFYCIPFAKLLYFAFGPILFIFGLFALKRGVRMGRLGLRQTAFVFMFLSAVKIFIFDLRFAKFYLLCEKKISSALFNCSSKGMKLFEFTGLVFLVLSCAVLFQFYRGYMRPTKPKVLQPSEVNLRFWANLGMASVSAMIIWTLAPWIGFLTVGSVPKIFSVLQWQHFAIANITLLLIGFWKAESCSWEYAAPDRKNPAKNKARSAYTKGGWSPRDTLWLNVFLYLVTLALSYVAHDILTGVYKTSVK